MLAVNDGCAVCGVCYDLNADWLCCLSLPGMLSIHSVYAGYPGWVAMLFMETD
jgi:hypothetical protein